MEKIVNKLLIVLEGLIAYHRELLSVEHEKLSSIINQDWQVLEQLVFRSRKILKDIETAEETRLDLVETICGNREGALADIGQSVSGKTGKHLQINAEKLRSLMREQKTLNQRIEALLQSSLEIVNFSISLFSGSGPGSRTYSGKGEEKAPDEKHTSLVFDVKA